MRLQELDMLLSPKERGGEGEGRGRESWLASGKREIPNFPLLRRDFTV